MRPKNNLHIQAAASFLCFRLYILCSKNQKASLLYSGFPVPRRIYCRKANVNYPKLVHPQCDSTFAHALCTKNELRNPLMLRNFFDFLPLGALGT